MATNDYIKIQQIERIDVQNCTVCDFQCFWAENSIMVPVKRYVQYWTSKFKMAAKKQWFILNWNSVMYRYVLYII